MLLCAFTLANAAIKVSKVTKGFQRKWRGMKGPKMKTLNIVRKIRKHRRKKKTFSKNFKGKVINGVHELFTMTIGMMLGLRCTVSQLFSSEHCRAILLISTVPLLPLPLLLALPLPLIRRSAE
jgi:hypothetical protein